MPLWTVVALVAVMVDDLLAIWSDLQEVDLMDRVLDGEAVTEEELDDNDNRQALVALAQLARRLVHPHLQPLAPEADRGRHLARQRPERAGALEGRLEAGTCRDARSHLVGGLDPREHPGNVVARLWWSGDTPDEIKEAAQADMAVSVIDIIAAAIAIAVVRSMTSRQEERTRRLATMPAPFEPPSQSYT